MLFINAEKTIIVRATHKEIANGYGTPGIKIGSKLNGGKEQFISLPFKYRDSKIRFLQEGNEPKLWVRNDLSCYPRIKETSDILNDGGTYLILTSKVKGCTPNKTGGVYCLKRKDNPEPIAKGSYVGNLITSKDVFYTDYEEYYIAPEVLVRGNEDDVFMVSWAKEGTDVTYYIVKNGEVYSATPLTVADVCRECIKTEVPFDSNSKWVKL